jgi:hypothetical protein
LWCFLVFTWSVLIVLIFILAVRTYEDTFNGKLDT